MSIAISIIVPVYNSESTLERCVQSILNQNFSDFELLLVDDGSTDESGKLCDSFASKDKRVSVIHKENSGVSDSRNIAIKQAKGTFLQFADSDDWITPDASKLLYQAATEYNCDMVIADFYRVVGRRISHKGNITSITPLSRIEFAEKMMEKPADFYYGVLWNKLYRREIIEKYGLYMDTNISWCEDFMFNLEYIRHAESFYAIHAPIYYYVRTKGSLASQGMSLPKTISMKKMVFAHYHQFYKDIFSEEDYEKKRLQIYRFLLDVADDGTAAPSISRENIMPGEKGYHARLMDIGIDNILTDEYMERKLLEYYLEQVAVKYSLKINDVRVLMVLYQLKQALTKKELADFLNISTKVLNRSMQKLSSRNYILIEEIKPASLKYEDYSFESYRARRRSRIKASVLPEADSILQELLLVQQEYEKRKYNHFSKEELQQYEYLENKMKENIREALR